jgi:hypothetical protein
MKTLTPADYEELRRGARVLAADRHGEKVLLRPDGRIIKLFRRKRLLSSALFFPYATRFERAASELTARGFRTVTVSLAARIPSIGRDAVVYVMLPGVSLRQALLDDPKRRDPLMNQWIVLLARLHAAGVYFRATHLANIIVPDDGGELAIIDVSEARCRRGPLSPALRARNFRPLVKYKEDVDAMRSFGAARFVAAYLQAASLEASPQRAFLARLARIDPIFAELPGPGEITSPASGQSPS